MLKVKEGNVNKSNHGSVARYFSSQNLILPILGFSIIFLLDRHDERTRPLEESKFCFCFFLARTNIEDR